MKTDKVKQEGVQVTATYTTEAEAREAAAAIDRDRIRMSGTVAEKADDSMDSIGDFIDILSRPHMAIMGWVLGLVSIWLASPSFGRLAPQAQFEIPLMVVGGIVILLIKTGAQRWAKADNLGSKALAEWYRNLVAAGVGIVFLVGVVFQFAVGVDQEAGVNTIEDQISDLEKEIRDDRFKAEDMIRPAEPVEDLEQEITYRLASPAKIGREPSTMSIGEAVGHGARDPATRQPPETFCMPNKDRQALIDKYCEDLIDMERGVRQRVRYEQALAAIAAKGERVEELRRTKPAKAGGLLMGEKLAEGSASKNAGAIWAAVLGAVLLLFIEAFMVFCTYVSKRHPKGVTEALAQLSPDKAAAAAGVPQATGG